MEKKILCMAVLFSLLSGCISSKVSNVHEMSNNLSDDVDKFIQLSNTSVELNKALVLKEQDHELSNGIFPQDKSKTKRESKVIYNTFQVYDIIYRNKKINDAYLKQNKVLVDFFKSMPLILDDRSVDIAGLVSNVDNLTQVIEKNVSSDGKVNEGINNDEKDLVTKTLSSGFKVHQYNTFKKSIREQAPNILEALKLRKSLFKENAKYISYNFLNEKYSNDYNNIQNSILNQFNSNEVLIARGRKPIPQYNLKELKKIDELSNQPYIYFNTINPVDKRYDEPKVKSAAYKKYCYADERTQKQEFLDFIEKNKNNSIVIADVSQDPPSLQSSFYDIERNYLKSGDQLVCELINIVGLMQENKFDDVHLKDFEMYLSNYDELLKYFSNLYLPKKEDK